ncbi:MAG: protein kinase [Planctomycetes bacterium]|nr:protein kinase [Planctomycetota bacterium]
MSEPTIGSTLGGCEIMEVIGHGGMGIIYRARQKSLDRVVALKVLSPKLANDVNFVTRFQREARAIAKVNHPNILAVYDVGADQDFHYMIMELIEGESLAEMQTRLGGPLKVEDACRFVRDAAQGLEAAHAGGITHRDVKPENIMITKKGVIKVSDFGLAKEADTSSTSTDAVMGTPAFMSPEQCDGKKIDHRTDIYSLGGTYYKMLTGRLPFEAETAMSMMYRHKHEALVPPHEIVPTVASSVGDVVVKMMAKKREQRYQTMTEVIVAIDQSIQATPAGISGRLASGRAAAPGLPPSPAAEIQLPPPAPEFNAPPPDRPLMRAPTGNTSIVGGRFDPPSGIGAALPPPGSKGSDRMVRGGVGGGAASSGKMVPPSFAASAGEDGFGLAARGDEMISRGDRVGGLKQYRQALQARNLDGATQQRLENEIQNEVRARRQAGENLLRRGLLVEASREFRIVIELDPKEESIRASLKEIDAKLSTKRTLINDIRTAIAGLQFEKAIQLWDRTPLDLRDEGLSKQIEHLRAVIVPSLKLCEQGEMYNEQGRLEEALATFQDALRIDQGCERARRGSAEAEGKLHRIEMMLKDGYEHHLKQDYQKAIETWKPIVALRPGHPQAVKSIVDAYVALAQSRRAQGDLKAALKCFAGAHEVDPQNRTVTRLFEEMTELHDKEQALIDRATEATAHGRGGEAIRYWKEVLRVNSANKTAKQTIESLGKARTVGMAKWVAILVVLAVGGYCGFQYFRENKALTNARELCEEQDYEGAILALKGQVFLFKGDEAAALEKEAMDMSQRKKGDELAAGGHLEEAAAEYEKLSARLPSGREKDFLILLVKELRAQSQMNQGDAALLKRQWKEARTFFLECQSLLRGLEDDKLKEMATRAEHSLIFSNEIEQAILSLRGGKRAEAIRHVKEAERMRPDQAIVAETKKELKYDPELSNAKIKEARKALNEPWRQEAFEEASKALSAAGEADPDQKQLDSLKPYLKDLETCHAKGMVEYVLMYYPNDPASGYDRSTSFCIDRYEYPNKAGEVPMTNVSKMEAEKHCADDGKQLCTWAQWSAACMAKQHFRGFSYGSDSKGGTCNTDGDGVKPAGSFSNCYNEIGAYDMNGNASEWTQDGDEGGAFQAGGNFKSGKDAASCKDTDRTVGAKDKRSALVGFRCCMKLPDK